MANENNGSSIEYINKTIFNITSKFKLKHQVKLGRKNQKGDRNDVVFKSDFTSKAYNIDMNLSSLTLDTSDYLVLEYKEDKDKQISIYLSYPHLYNMKRILKRAIRWFYDEKYNGLFIEKNDEIKFNSKFKNLRYETDLTIDGKNFSIKPSIVEKNDIYEEGVIICLDNEYLVSLTINELEAFYDVFSNFDLYQNSLILVTYVLTSHPEQLLNNMSSNYSSSNRSVPKTDQFKPKQRNKKGTTKK